jgi:hypothetical protein
MDFKYLAVAVLAMCSLSEGGLVVTPIDTDQVVGSLDGDCFFGVSTPQGCGPLRDSAS